VQQLEAIGMPVDLVGHNWGAAHAIGVAMTRPDMLRSWCVDTIGWFEPDYTWHSLARTWQTPGPGEIAAAEMTHSSLTRRTAYLSGLCIPARIAAELASGANRVAAACMLELYRTSQQPVMRHLGEQLPAAAQRPGLVLWRPPITALALPAARPPNALALRSPCWLALVTGGCWRIQPP
jgi:pimeloyl-ACP methyl ester carboxylesterase